MTLPVSRPSRFSCSFESLTVASFASSECVSAGLADGLLASFAAGAGEQDGRARPRTTAASEAALFLLLGHDSPGGRLGLRGGALSY